MARKNGIFVEEFAIGMGPILLKKQIGETLYSIRLFPIGGFCRMLGEDAESNDSRAFNNKSVKARIEVVVAGVIMNFILGFLIFLFITLNNGYVTNVISSLTPDFPASNAGLQLGDEIISVNGHKTSSYNEIVFRLQSVDPNNVEFVISRNGEKIPYNIKMEYSEEAGKYLLGFTPMFKAGVFSSQEELDEASEYSLANGMLPPVKAGVLESIAETFDFISFYFTATISSLGQMFTNLDLSNATGLIGIFGVVDTQYNEASSVSAWFAFETILNMIGTISLALAVFNILPIPALDGGRLVFLIIEAVRGKPVDPEKEGMIHMVGFVLLMLFALIVAYSDLTKLF